MSLTLRTLASALLASTLTAAPWLYGGAQDWAVALLCTSLTLCSALWIGSKILCTEKTPATPRRIWYSVAVISACAWLSLWSNSSATMDSFTASHLERLLERWPRSVMILKPAIAAWFAAIVPMVVLIVSDFARDKAWQKRFAMLLTLSAAGIAALGIWQNAQGAAGIFFEEGVRMPGAFFGTFYHHTSAGAFLNLSWPIALGLLLGAVFCKETTSIRRTVTTLVFMVLLAVILAAHTAHISRFPQIAAIVAGALLALVLLSAKTSGAFIRRRPTVFALIGIVMIVVAVWTASHGQRIHEIASRWRDFLSAAAATSSPIHGAVPKDQWSEKMRDDLFVESDHSDFAFGPRGAAWSTGKSAAKQAGLLGTGAGSWPRIQSAHTDDAFLNTFYLHVQFAHQDYLQGIVEQGWIAAAAWFFLIVSGIALALKTAWIELHVSTHLKPSTFITLGAITCLVALMAQSMIDFPLQIPAIRLQAAALLGLCWAAWRTSHESISG